MSNPGMQFKLLIVFFTILACNISKAQSPYMYAKNFLTSEDKLIGIVSLSDDTTIDMGLVPDCIKKEGIVRIKSQNIKDYNSPIEYLCADTSGKILGNIKFEYCGTPYHRVVLGFNSGKVFLLNKNGKIKELDKVDKIQDFKDGFAPVSSIEKYTFVNTEGNFLSEFKYDAVSGFNEGTAAVKINDKWGIIDSTGKTIINPEYFNAKPFHQGLAVVQESPETYFFIDRKGKKVLGPFNRASSFSEGLAFADFYDKPDGFINQKGKLIIPTEDNEIFLEDAELFSEGLVAVKNYNWGYMDKTGKMITAFDYTEAGEFQNGFALVGSDRGSCIINRKGNRMTDYYQTANGWYYDELTDYRISQFTKYIMPEKKPVKLISTWFDYYPYFFTPDGDTVKIGDWHPETTFYKGLCQVNLTESEKYFMGMVNQDAQLISGKCDQVSYYNGKYFWAKKDGKYAMMNASGKLISEWFDEIDMEYTGSGLDWGLNEMLLYYSDDVLAVRSGEKWGYYSLEGKIIYKPVFTTHNKFVNGFTLAGQGGKIYSIDKSGHKTELQFESTKKYSKYLIAVKKNGKWALADYSGKVKTEFIYNDVSSDYLRRWTDISNNGIFTGFLFTSDKVIISDEYGKPTGEAIRNISLQVTGDNFAIFTGNKSYVVDTTGNLILKNFEDFGMINPPYISVKKAGKWGFADETGKIIIPCKYDSAGIAYDEIFPIAQKTNGILLWGFCDINGKIIIQPTYLDSKRFSSSLAAVKSTNGKWGYIDISGKTVIDFKFMDCESFDYNQKAKVSDNGSRYYYINVQGECVENCD